MVKSKAATPTQYIKELPLEKREVIEKVRNVILDNLPKGYEEIMQYGMLAYAVPLSIYPSGYAHDKKTPLTYIALAAQKNFYVIHAMSVYLDKQVLDWFTSEYKKSGKKLDMGKGCIRFTKLENLPLDVIAKLVAKIPPEKYAQNYEKFRSKR